MVGLPPLHCPHCTALHSLHPCCTIPSPPTSSILETNNCQTNMSQFLPTSLSHTHVTQSGTTSRDAGRHMCACVGDVYAVTAGGGLSFARDCAVHSTTCSLCCTVHRTSCCTAWHTLSLSHPRPTPRPFNLFPWILHPYSQFSKQSSNSILPNNCRPHKTKMSPFTTSDTIQAL